MMMQLLWERIDGVINAFVYQNKENNDSLLDKNAFIMWKLPILFAKAFCQSTDTVLRGSKTIVSVPSSDAANMLKCALQKKLSEKALLVLDAKTKKMRPFKLNIKIISCSTIAGQLILKKSDIPVTKHGLSFQDVRNMINEMGRSEISSIERQRTMYGNNLSESASKNFDNQIEEINQRYDKLINNTESKLDVNKKYCVNFVKPYAMSYRVTYSDDSTNRRKQTAVGDVLIVIHGTEVVDDKRITKKRSDSFFLKNKDKFITSAAGISIFAE